MDEWIPMLAIGLPLLATAVVIFFAIRLVTKPSRDIQRLEERAAAGDPQAKEALARMRDLQGAMQRAAGGDDPERQRLLVTGVLTRGTIVDVRPTGLEISAGPVPSRIVEVDLSLEDAAGKRTITVREAVSELHQGRLLKGANVPMRVDPNNPARAAVLWDTQ